MRIYELQRRRMFVAAFLGEVYNVVNEGLSQNQFNQLMRNPQIRRFQPNHADEEDVQSAEVCSICMEPLQYDASFQLPGPCNHRYHSVCAEHWFKRKARCPLCNYNVRLWL